MRVMENGISNEFFSAIFVGILFGVIAGSAMAILSCLPIFDRVAWRLIIGATGLGWALGFIYSVNYFGDDEDTKPQSEDIKKEQHCPGL